MDKRDQEFIRVEKALKEKGYFLNPDSKRDSNGVYMLFWKDEEKVGGYLEIRFYLWK